MSKNILVISASPRKGGNSDTLCGQFIKGAAEAGHQSEKVYFNDKTINYCSGCGVCFTKHECPQKDDMADVLDKMIRADVLVLASPVYFYCMNAQLKTLIDRTTPKYEEIKNKDFYFILTAADSEKEALNGTLAGLRGFTSCLPGANEKGVVCGTGMWNIGDAANAPAVKAAYEMGRNIAL
ncbi:MAG: flavodoxin family protein [Clostridiales bacterium]|nr:flavodoxin family protein [Clostridiales bacterium]